MDEGVFYRALMLAIAERLRSFKADGDRYHAAFGVALKAFGPDTLVARILEGFDPVFGVYKGAEDLLFLAMRDLFIDLGAPSFKTVYVKISPAQARKELEELPIDTAAFRNAAKAFETGLEAPRPVRVRRPSVSSGKL